MSSNVPISYNTPIRSRERILGFGVGGVGKSTMTLSIARMLPNRHFHVIDNDVSPSYNRALDSEFSDVKNVTVYETDPDDWEDGLSTVERVAPTVEYDDWFTFDSMTSPWSAVQSWFIEKLHGESDDEYFFRVRKEVEEHNQRAKNSSGMKELKSANPFEGFMDWPAINKQYFKLTKAIFRCRGHVILTAEMDKTGDKEDDEIKGLFGPYGVKPRGQKKLGHQTHTVLLMTKTRQGNWQMTTIKDRSRGEMLNQPFEDFGKDYLRGVAGWRPVVLNNDLTEKVKG